MPRCEIHTFETLGEIEEYAESIGVEVSYVPPCLKCGKGWGLHSNTDCLGESGKLGTKYTLEIMHPDSINDYICQKCGIIHGGECE